MEENRKDRSKTYLIIVIIVLLLLNSFFVYNYFSDKNKITVVQQELSTSEDAQVELDSLLNVAGRQLNSYKGKNAELDSVINLKNAELQAKAEEINTLLKQKNTDKDKLKKALLEIEGLRYYVQKYLAQIDDLSKENESLKQANQGLNQELKKSSREKEDLNMENLKLANKVSLGSKLKAESILVSGVRKKNNRESETNRAGKAEFIKVSFTLGDNIVAEKNTKTVYLKLITPEGSTLHNESLGSGKFNFDGSENLYTTKQDFNFENTRQTLSFYWSNGDMGFAPGKYKAVVYCEGHQIGEKEFELR